MKCKDCTEPWCPYRTSDAEKECYYYMMADASVNETSGVMYSNLARDIMYNALRAKAAISFGSALVASHPSIYRPEPEVTARLAVEYAEALIKELKENEEIKSKGESR